ncbi:MAG: ABC transporter permease [Limibacillus sp.]
MPDQHPSSARVATVPGLGPRLFGAVNRRGLWTLLLRGLTRFFKMPLSSVAGPIASQGLFLAVFVVAYKADVLLAGSFPPLTFVAPGIIAFSMTHTAFEQGAFPVLFDKLEGMIQDVMMAPLTPLEVTLGYVGSAAFNGLFLGLCSLAIVTPFAGLTYDHPLAVLYFAVMGCMLFALLGVVAGLWAEKWDRYSAVETFLILPLGMLSGAFFPLASVPESWQAPLQVNPAYYVIDGMRYGLIGRAETDLLLGAGYLLVYNLLLALLVSRLFARGYKLRS